MFQFSGFASWLLRMIPLQGTGLPHSEIHGSTVICTLPWLIAAYHVLLRLWEPRHPPYALIYFFLLYARTHNVCLFPKFSSNMSKNLSTIWRIVDNKGIEPLVIKLKNRLSSPNTNFQYFIKNKFSWRIRESNPWPPACKAGALANWANPPRI